VVNYNHSLISIGFSGSQLRDLERNSKALWKQLCSTDSVLQICRDITKEQLFGSADVNVKYASAVAARMCDLGHEVKLVFSTRRQVLTDVSSIVLNEELARRKKLKQSMNGAERNKYVLDDKFLNDALALPLASIHYSPPMELRQMVTCLHWHLALCLATRILVTGLTFGSL